MQCLVLEVQREEGGQEKESQPEGVCLVKTPVLGTYSRDGMFATVSRSSDYGRWLGTFFASGTHGNSSVNERGKLSATGTEVMPKTPKVRPGDHNSLGISVPGLFS